MVRPERSLGRRKNYSPENCSSATWDETTILARFELVAARFGPWTVPKCLENGPFWDQRWVKTRSDTRFSKSDRGPFGVHKHVKPAHFEPVFRHFVFRHFGPSKVPKSLENGPFWNQKYFKNGSKNVFPKMMLDHLGCYIYLL